MQNEERVDLNRQVSVGEQAESLLSNDLLVSLIFSKKNAACEAFMNTSIGDDKGRKKLWHDAQAVITFEKELQALVDTGNIAKKLLIEADQLHQPNYNPIEKPSAKGDS